MIVMFSTHGKIVKACSLTKDRDRCALFFSRTTKRESTLFESKRKRGGISKERKYLTWHRKLD